MGLSEQDRVIAAELAACVLGARERVELRMDLPGQLARVSIAHRIFAIDAGAALLPAMREATAALSRIVRDLRT